MDTRTLFVFCVVAAVGLAGCTAPGQGNQQEDEVETTFRITQNNGITISFQSLQQKYFEDGQIVLDFSVQNTGQSQITNLTARLFGASFLAGERLQLSRTRLQGVDQAAKQPGAIATATFQKQNPVDLRQGETQSYPVGVRVMYDYNTSASAAFRVVPRDQFEGRSELVTTDNTAAPVKAGVSVQSPKPVSARSGADNTSVSVPVVIRNVGGGKVVQNIAGDRGQVAVDVSFPLASPSTAKITDCGGSGSGETRVSFPRGSTQRRIVCTAVISGDVFDTQLTIDVGLDYTYFQAVDTTFQVEGLSGDQTG